MQYFSTRTKGLKTHVQTKYFSAMKRRFVHIREAAETLTTGFMLQFHLVDAHWGIVWTGDRIPPITCTRFRSFRSQDNYVMISYYNTSYTCNFGFDWYCSKAIKIALVPGIADMYKNPLWLKTKKSARRQKYELN